MITLTWLAGILVSASEKAPYAKTVLSPKNKSKRVEIVLRESSSEIFAIGKSKNAEIP